MPRSATRSRRSRRSSQELSTRRQGSAKTLQGYIYSLSIFLSDAQSHWRKKDKIKILNRTRRAEAWLRYQASFYGIPLAFHPGGNYGLTTDIEVDYIPSAAGTPDEYSDWVSYALQRATGPCPVALYNHIVRTYRVHNVHVLLHANKAGVSYAMPCTFSSDTDRYFLEGCMIYGRDKFGFRASTGSIAHEILHLYGAWDLYENYAVTREQGKQAAKLFPHDIMRSADEPLNLIGVGPLTAWRVGWTERKEEWFEFFRPDYECKAAS